MTRSTLNTFRLELEEVRDEDQVQLNGVLLIDGRQVSGRDGYALNWAGLTRALLSEGEHYPITCSCGDAGCAGIWTPVTAVHVGPLLHWTLLAPYKLGRLAFNREQAIAHTVVALLDARRRIELLAFNRQEDYPLTPHGMEDRVVDWCVSSLRAGELLPPPWDRRSGP